METSSGSRTRPAPPPRRQPYLPLRHRLGRPLGAARAVAVLFALDGFVFGSWAARVPDVSAQVGASHAVLGALLLCMSLGALATMRLTGTLCERVGAGRASAAAAALACAAVVLPAVATSVVQLGAALLLFGAATGMLNVAINSAGVDLTASGGKPLLPLLHAVFSFGGLAGGLLGGLAAVVATPAVHLVGVAAVGLAVVRAVAPTLLERDRPTAPGTAAGATSRGLPPGTRATVVVLGVIAGCTAYGEGALSDWGALHLRTNLDASPVLAAAGYAGFSLAMGCGRLLGHRLLVRLGETTLLVSGAVLASVGMLVAAWSPLLGPALLGFVLVGLGLANLFPLAIGRAGALGGPGGVALASSVGYSGLLGGPPVIGFLAGWSGLPTALTTIPLLTLAAAALALGVRQERASSPARAAAWYDAALLVRPGARLAPVAVSLGLAAQRHVETLRPLTPGTTRPHHVRPGTAAGGRAHLAAYPGLEHLAPAPAD